ncbi:zinc ribbon domain-containing protein [Methanoregula sp.]|uniref:zinc ribbon domain-containing protein n=1 Tax=Methanoregula sp. TaxID=2052170 RepID=UPI003C707453
MSADTAFCESCGARIGPPPTCSLCGTLLTPGSRFCSSCGTVVGNSKDNPPDKPEDPGKILTPTRKLKVSRAKKPKTAEENEQEKKPDPLMMIPEPDIPNNADDSGVPEMASAKKILTPDLISDQFIPPSSDKNKSLPSRSGRKKLAVMGVIVILVAAAALMFTGVLHIPVPISSGGDASLSAVTAETTTPVPSETTAIQVVEQTAIPVTNAEIVSLVPGPTQIPPDKFLVYFQVERDPLSKMVSVTYMGGKGQMGVQNVFVRLTRSDGQVLTGTFKPVQIGSGVELQGTEKVDRVEVIVHYYTGDEYTVIDQTFEYKKLS